MFIKKLGTLILSSISIFLIIILALSFTVSSFLHPQVYFQAFEKAGVYSYLDENLNNSQNMFIKIPVEGTKPLVETLFSNLLAYMRSDTDELNLYVKIDQDKLRNFFLDSIGDLPECRNNQNPFDEKNPCLQNGMTKDEFLDRFLASKNISFFEKDTVDLAKVYGIEKGSENRQNLDEIRGYIKYYQFSLIISIIALVIIFLLIFMLQKPETVRFIRTLSLILIFPTLVLIIIIYSLKNIEGFLNFPDPLFESIFVVVRDVLTNKLIIFALIIGITGITLLILSFFIKSQDKPKVKQLK